MMTARELAYYALEKVEEKGGFSNLVLKDMLRESGLSKRDKSLATALVYGVLRDRLFLDRQIGRFCNLKKTPAKVLRLLRLGAFQICRMDKIPPSAAVNETVSFAKKIVPQGAGCCNGVLRKVAEQETWLPSRTDWAQYLSVCYSFPLWLVKKWEKQFGTEELESILAGFSQHQPLSVRVNLLKTTVEAVCQEFTELEPSILPDAFYLPGIENIEVLPAWREGRITVMRPSSMMACLAAEVKPGTRVCDMCAAPGGKTAYLAQIMKQQGSIDAWELHPHRAELLKRNLERLGVGIAAVSCRDSSIYEEVFRERFDTVLLDAPCSGLGVIGQKPELKWQDPDRIQELLPVQRQLLLAGANYVKPGGTLVYSTCTLNRAENETMVTWLTGQMRDVVLDLTFGEGTGMKNLLPHRDGTGGFFIARLKKLGKKGLTHD